ncbi:hypothetical protein [Mitsuaria sp. 7]|uniref:hypothetical protein n=1 Tax=Mitsuaria sp. 7 TaxID=1658665 RepID=UPI0007DD18D7|nr:hypothetical protein [Mitsuaria sp. 7]ANH70057.1 hypothetical protein ABE85_25175 [Mitsuaria sp. 7]
MKATERQLTADATPGIPIKQVSRNAEPEVSLGEMLQQFMKEQRRQDALPENSPIARWVKRNFDEDPPQRPRNPALDFLNSP